MIPQRWEHGSDFHLVEVNDEHSGGRLPWHTRAHVFAGSGREALRQLVTSTDATRVWFPSYYCADVVDYVLRAGIDARVYHDNPTQPFSCPLEQLDATDLVVVVNTWGLRAQPSLQDRRWRIVEDHTHDFLSSWAFSSCADYAFASLRKTLPLPDGGVLWTPNERATLPSARAPSQYHASLVEMRLSAMALKGAWLEGERCEKPLFLDLYRRSEEGYAEDRESGLGEATLTSLRRFPIHEWRSRRCSNFRAFAMHLHPSDKVQLLLPAPGAVPFAATLLFSLPSIRDSVRTRLISENIYPAILWPPRNAIVPHADARELSRLVLSLHCDFRYTNADMQRLADAVARAVSQS